MVKWVLFFISLHLISSPLRRLPCTSRQLMYKTADHDSVVALGKEFNVGRTNHDM